MHHDGKGHSVRCGTQMVVDTPTKRSLQISCMVCFQRLKVQRRYNEKTEWKLARVEMLVLLSGHSLFLADCGAFESVASLNNMIYSEDRTNMVARTGTRFILIPIPVNQVSSLSGIDILCEESPWNWGRWTVSQ